MQWDKKNNKRQLCKEKSQTVFIPQWHDYLENPEESIKEEILELISEFSKISIYKVNTQNSTSFYIPQKITGIGIFKVPLATASKIWKPRDQFNKMYKNRTLKTTTHCREKLKKV